MYSGKDKSDVGQANTYPTSFHESWDVLQGSQVLVKKKKNIL